MAHDWHMGGNYTTGRRTFLFVLQYIPHPSHKRIVVGWMLFSKCQWMVFRGYALVAWDIAAAITNYRIDDRMGNVGPVVSWNFC
jgi:hypothetical protein